MKLCPFCGSDDVEVVEVLDPGEIESRRKEAYVAIECFDCHARGPLYEIMRKDLERFENDVNTAAEVTGWNKESARR